MFTFDATEQINEVSRTRTTQVITRYFGRWPQTKRAKHNLPWYDLHKKSQNWFGLFWYVLPGKCINCDRSLLPSYTALYNHFSVKSDSVRDTQQQNPNWILIFKCPTTAFMRIFGLLKHQQILSCGKITIVRAVNIKQIVLILLLPE